MHKIVVDKDHVHMFVSVPLDMSISEALQYLKGGSSYRIFRFIRTSGRDFGRAPSGVLGTFQGV